jgi:hypothetical protein
MNLAFGVPRLRGSDRLKAELRTQAPPAAVETGRPLENPGGPSSVVPQCGTEGGQDAALYGRRDARRHHQAFFSSVGGGGFWFGGGARTSGTG